MARKYEPAPCHPDRPLYAKDLCAPCYNRSNYRSRNSYALSDKHDGLVRVPVKGWGCL